MMAGKRPPAKTKNETHFDQQRKLTRQMQDQVTAFKVISLEVMTTFSEMRGDMSQIREDVIKEVLTVCDKVGDLSSRVEHLEGSVFGNTKDPNSVGMAMFIKEIRDELGFFRAFINKHETGEKVAKGERRGQIIGEKKTLMRLATWQKWALGILTFLASVAGSSFVTRLIEAPAPVQSSKPAPIATQETGKQELKNEVKENNE
jgi:hypothetical protein